MRLAPAFGGPTGWRRVTPVAVVWQDEAGVWVETGRSRRRAVSLWPALEATLAEAGPEAWAAGFCAYEWAPVVEPLVAVARATPRHPLAWWAVIGPAGTARYRVRAGGSRSPLALSGCSLSESEFRNRVSRIRAAIASGDVYQVNLTRRWQAAGAKDPEALFRHLTARGVPRYGAYLADLEQGWAVLCLSPELLLSRRGMRLETRPIKGTRRRASGRAGLARARAELAASTKDAAELAMIVDLERNDLHRVCRPGSVLVAEPSVGLTAGEVVHREAVVTGELVPGTDWTEILAAVFPGGSVTGAPKLAACRVIASLEPAPRGVYCGLLGVLRPDGDAVFALPIRTGVVAGGTLVFHAGAGIVWDSDPAEEERESRDKVIAWLRSAGGGS